MPFSQREARDVAAGRAVGAARVDERALAVVRAEVADASLRRSCVVYSRSIAASMPMNVELPLRLTTRSVSIAAPMAPASPVCGWTNTSAPGHALLDVVDLRLDGREVVLRAALEDELASRATPCAGSARRTARRSSAAPARGRRASPPWRSPPSGSSRGRCRGRPRSRSENLGASSALKATSANSVTGTPN